MHENLFLVGVLSVIAAIVGGNLPLPSVFGGGTVPPLKGWRGLLLGLFGVVCILVYYNPKKLFCAIPGVCAERGDQLFVGDSARNRGWVSVSAGQEGLSNPEIGYTHKNASDHSVALYEGIEPGRNQGYVTTKPGTFRQGQTRLLGYIDRDQPFQDGSTHLYVVEGTGTPNCDSIDGQVTTASPLSNCNTDPIGWTIP